MSPMKICVQPRAALLPRRNSPFLRQLVGGRALALLFPKALISKDVQILQKFTWNREASRNNQNQRQRESF